MSGKIDPAAEFLALFPEVETIKLGESQAEIRVLDARHLAAVARILKPVVTSSPSLRFDISSKDVVVISLAMTELLADHGERMFEAIAVALDWTPDRVGSLPPDKLIEIATAIVRKNYDFFTLRVAPLAADALENASGETVGATSLPT